MTWVNDLVKVMAHEATKAKVLELQELRGNVSRSCCRDSFPHPDAVTLHTMTSKEKALVYQKRWAEKDPERLKRSREKAAARARKKTEYSWKANMLKKYGPNISEELWELLRARRSFHRDICEEAKKPGYLNARARRKANGPTSRKEAFYTEHGLTLKNKEKAIAVYLLMESVTSAELREKLAAMVRPAHMTAADVRRLAEVVNLKE